MSLSDSVVTGPVCNPESNPLHNSKSEFRACPCRLRVWSYFIFQWTTPSEPPEGSKSLLCLYFKSNKQKRLDYSLKDPVLHF